MKKLAIITTCALFFSGCATNLTTHNSSVGNYTDVASAKRVKSKAIGPGSRDQDKYVAEVKHF
jgi:uncharacterized protein YceK